MNPTPEQIEKIEATIGLGLEGLATEYLIEQRVNLNKSVEENKAQQEQKEALDALLNQPSKLESLQASAINRDSPMLSTDIAMADVSFDDAVGSSPNSVASTTEVPSQGNQR